MSKVHNKVTDTYYWLRCNIPLCIVLVILFFSTSCGKTPAPPVPVVTNPSFRPLIAIDVEIDTPPLYQLGHEVAVQVANKIDDMATRVNSGGVVIFVCRISSHSFEDCPVSFETPDIPAFVLPPPSPTCDPAQPYDCSKLKQQYKKDVASWEVEHTRQVNNLASVAAWVHQKTNSIRTLQFQYDAAGSDIFGGLATAAQNFQGVGLDTPKFLVLATDFISTTQENGSFSLAGVSVSAIYRTCSDNAYCQQSNAFWSSVVRRAGATSFQTYSPAASIALGLSVAA